MSLTLKMMSMLSPQGSEFRNDILRGTVLELKNELACMGAMVYTGTYRHTLTPSHPHRAHLKVNTSHQERGGEGQAKLSDHSLANSL